MQNIRTSFRKSFKRAGVKKWASTLSFLDHTPEELKSHLESQFTEGMSWDNYKQDGWHIDHIMPCDAFDWINGQEIKWCWSLENLRPLWASENMSKGNKIILEEVQKLSFYDSMKEKLK